MKQRMMQIAVVVGVVVATLTAQAKVLPEFMNAQQLTAWRAQHIAPVVAGVNATDEQVQFFTGKPYDAVSGTYLFKCRRYDPTRARWTSVDPLGCDSGYNNLYNYAGYNPCSRLDPDGAVDVSINLPLGGSLSIPLDDNYIYAQIKATEQGFSLQSAEISISVLSLIHYQTTYSSNPPPTFNNNVLGTAAGPFNDVATLSGLNMDCSKLNLYSTLTNAKVMVQKTFSTSGGGVPPDPMTWLKTHSSPATQSWDYYWVSIQFSASWLKIYKE